MRAGRQADEFRDQVLHRLGNPRRGQAELPDLRKAARPVGQRMALAREQVGRLPPKGRHRHPRIGREVTHIRHEEFDVFGEQSLEQQLPVVHLQAQPDAGILLAQREHRQRHDRRGRKRAGAEGGVAQFALSIEQRVALQAAGIEEQPAGALDQEHARRRGLDGARLTVEQAHADLAFDRLDAAAEGRLAQVHALGRTREMALVGQCNHVPETLEVDHREMLRMH